MQGMQIALENAQMLIWELDFSNGELRYEDEHLRFLGIITDTPPQNVEKWIALIHPDDRAAFIENFKLALQPGAPDFDLEYRYAQQPERWGWAHTKGQVIQRDANGTPLLAVGSTLNITTRKQAELESQTAQQSFEIIFNSNPDVMVISRLPEGIITNVNDAFVLNTGYSREEAIGKTTVDLAFWSDEDRHMMTDAIKKNGYCSGLEFDFLMKDGQKRTGSFSAVVTSLQGVPHLVSTIHDITSRKQMGNALQTSEARFRAIIDATPDPLALNDAQGNITYLNRAFKDIIGYTLKDIPTLDEWWRLAYPDPLYRSQISGGWQHALENAKPGGTPVPPSDANVMCKDGNERTFVIGATLLEGDQSGLHLVTFYDITGRKQAAIKLLQSEILLRTTLDSTDEGILMIAHDGSVLSANRRFMELWRIPQAIAESGEDKLLLGHVLEQLVDPEAFMNQVRRLYDSDEDARDTLHFKDGRVFARFTRALTIDAARGRIWCFKDISEQAHAQTALAEREEIYRSIVTQANDSIMMINADTFRFVEFNDAACANLGYSREEFSSLTIPDIQADLGFEDIAEKLREIMTLGSAEFESAHRHKDGSLRNVRISVKALRIQGQDFTVSIVTDITDRKKNESALAASKTLLQTIINTVPMRIFWKDTESRFLGCNPAFTRDAGMSEPDDLLGKTDYQMMWKDQAELYRADDLQVMTSGQAKLSFDEPQTTPDGQTIWLRTSKIPLHNQENETIGILGIYEDITERKQIEIELIQTKERYDFATTVGHVGTWDWSPITGVLFWSDETFRLMGYEPGSTIPTYELYLSLVHPDDREMLNTAVLAALHEDKPYALDCRIVLGDDNQLVCHVTGKVEFNEEHQPVRMLGTIQDVSERYQAAETLRATEQKLRVILDNVDAYIYLKDADGNYLFANKPVRELWHAEMSDIIGYGDEKFFDAQTASHIRSNDQKVLFDCESLRTEETNTIPETGLTATFLSTKLPLRLEDGSIYALCGISTDITTRKQTELELAEREAQLRTLIEAVPDAIQFKDGDGRWLIANNICLSSFGLEGKEWKNLTDAEIGLRYPHLAEAMEACIAGDNEAWAAGQIFRDEHSGTGPNGVINHYEVHKIPLFDEQKNRKAMVIVARDVTDKKQSEELIWHQANFDFLTQLPNRRMFRDRLSQDLKKAHRAGLKLALLFLDLDHFKEVNDTLGHDMGDVLLVEAAQRITACVRESDTVARLGGDEFTIILAELDDVGAVERIADNIIHTLRLPFQLGDNTVYVSVSIGITLYPNDCTELEELLKNADQSMFAAKQAGRNRYCYFTSAMQQAAQYRIRIINDLRIALSEGQFRLHYQPIVELSTGHVHKAEALLRWFHPEHGLISPAEFIPLAEESGIIHELGDWVFAEAAKQLSHCQRSCVTGFQISVNVSPIQFHGINKQSQWLENLKDIGLSGDSIVIEITEGLLLDNSSNVTEQLLAFRDAGIQVAIDDFGTGYSALSYLKKLDIDYLKIDQSFIRNLTTDSSDMALVEAIVVMAHKLDLKVIAEGVETAEQNQRLTDIGCDFVQGYFHSRPLPADQLEAWLKQRRAASN